MISCNADITDSELWYQGFKNMISYLILHMISYVYYITKYRYHSLLCYDIIDKNHDIIDLWYHRWYHRQLKTYDIIGNIIITWYHIWYHVAQPSRCLGLYRRLLRYRSWNSYTDIENLYFKLYIEVSAISKQSYIEDHFDIEAEIHIRISKFCTSISKIFNIIISKFSLILSGPARAAQGSGKRMQAAAQYRSR